MTGLVIALLWFPLLGAAFARLFGRTSWFLAGAGVNGLALCVAGVLHVPLKPVIAALGLIAIVILSRADGEGSRPPRPFASLGVTWPLHVSAALLLLCAILTPLTDYDGRAFWLLKAKAIAHEQAIDGPFFQQKSTYSPRNEYPLLVPLDAATVMMFARDTDDRHTRAFFALFPIALAFEMRRRFGGWIPLLLLWIPQIQAGALSAGSDIPLAAFAGCALFELLDRRAVHFGFWIACLALTKSEGLPFALFFFIAGLFVFRMRIYVAAIPLAIALASLFAWRAHILPSDESDFLGQLGAFPKRIAFTGEALREFAPWFLRVREWGLLWIAVAIAIIVLTMQRNWRPLALGLAAIMPMLTLYVVAYVVTDWEIAELVRVTAARLVSHFIAPALFLVAAALGMPQSRQWSEPFEPSREPSSPRV